jgi:KDO2-lipid IV(A) lauroyltransferase
MDKLVDFRAKKNVRLAITSSAPREVLQALRRNEYVGLLLDVGTQHDGDTVPVTFFGIPTRFPVGPAILALRTGAPIVVGYALVREDHHIDAFAYPPILVTPSGNKERDIRDCLQRIVAYFEDFIARNPDQWYMYRPMWATNAPVSVQDLPTADPLAEHAN